MRSARAVRNGDADRGGRELALRTSASGEDLRRPCLARGHSAPAAWCFTTLWAASTPRPRRADVGAHMHATEGPARCGAIGPWWWSSSWRLCGCFVPPPFHACCDHGRPAHVHGRSSLSRLAGPAPGWVAMVAAVPTPISRGCWRRVQRRRSLTPRASGVPFLLAGRRREASCPHGWLGRRAGVGLRSLARRRCAFWARAVASRR